MSPEQARGDNDAIDARSDLYSAMALFYELVTLRHYLDGRDTLPAVLEGAQRGLDRFLYPNLFSHAHQPLPPAELLHLARHGLSADPKARFQSAGEIIDRLHEVLEGKVRVQCHATMTKRMFRELGRFVDRSPNLMFLVFVGTATLVLAALGVLVSSAL
jgi:serine/threonine protein kinase